ncbi:hypothetical protein pb186bvf_018510 [Paramecium bursaria]
MKLSSYERLVASSKYNCYHSNHTKIEISLRRKQTISKQESKKVKLLQPSDCNYQQYNENELKFMFALLESINEHFFDNIFMLRK